MQCIDYRSDTLTKPTHDMREVMSSAIVGDDVYQEDPTTIQLENRIAKLFRKESALFFPTGTMSNLTAVLAWCDKRGSEIIVGDKSHMFLYEQAGVSQFGGVSMRIVKNLGNGSMELGSIQDAIRDSDIHEPITSLICIENTHNACGGRILAKTFLKKLQQLSKTNCVPIHMDGARIWNASSASHEPVHKIAKYVDSLTVCLSKGLGCPVGSVLLGSEEFISKARRIRKGLGGGMRQTGVLSACGLVALDDFESGVLKKDHIICKILAYEIKDMSGFKIWNEVETNILFIEIIGGSENVTKLLMERGIRVSAWSHDLIRLVIHRDIQYNDIDLTINAFKDISTILCGA
jgi:threonine aldolase